VRKIISILVALGLVLALAAVATPVAAKVTGPTDATPDVSFNPDCACEDAAYNITFNISASLTEGVHCVCIKFPAGTTVPTSYKTGDIIMHGSSVGPHAVFAEEITVSGTEVCFLAPVHYTVADNPILVEFTGAADLANPCTPGYYKLEVRTCREPDVDYVLSDRYLVKPCVSEYGFFWDSGPTYPGIEDDFVPPFKVCGQANNATIGITGAVSHYYLPAPAYMNAFNLTFGPTVVGCLAPCANVTFKMALTASPQFPCAAAVDPWSTVTLNFTSGSGAPMGWNLTYDMCIMDEPLEITIGTVPLGVATTETWEGLIHFDTVGAYTICFWAECPGGAGGICVPGSADDVIVERCFDFEAHQWKDAGKIVLEEKWNLISLPLVPFDTDIDVLLASLDAEALDGDGVDDLISIWNYDGCADVWTMYADGGLTDMVDGDAYWVRMSYPMGNYTWWVWGTARPMPPAAPSAYPVCAGWNMFGFTHLVDMASDAYLWNFPAGPTRPLVYGWDNTGTWTTSDWNLIDIAGSENLESGQGYWGYFPSAGTVVPPTP
jgi:hypothetical protein